MHRLISGTSALVLVTLAARAALAATIAISDCTGPPVDTVFRRTIIDQPLDDVVIQCPLMPLRGTERVHVHAKSVVVDGRNGGSISASGKGLAIDVEAVGTDATNRSILIDTADLVAPNNNGKISLHGPGLIQITGSTIRTGGNILLTCTGAGCPIGMTGSTTQSNKMAITAEGTITLARVIDRTRPPLDRIIILSNGGDIVISPRAGDPVGVCAEEIANECPGPNCPLPITVTTVEEAKAICGDCLQVDNRIEMSLEGNLTIEAALGKVDLTASKIHAGENIELRAATDIRTVDAYIDNCGPKNGTFTVTSATCTVDGGTMLDDQPELAPTLTCAMVGTPAAYGTCDSRH